MRVVSLHVYPVKGCHRVDLVESAVQPWGLTGDRRWLIVDSEGRAVTQRDHTGLVRIRPELVPGGLRLRVEGFGDLTVAEPADAEYAEVTVWSFTGNAALAAAEAHEWLSDVLHRPVRLAWLDDPTRRVVDQTYGESEDRVSFADGYPLLLANKASLRSLNDLIAESGSTEGPLPMTRFRPNVVIDEAPAWVEDSWTNGRLQIGEVGFRVPKPCGRCVVTTTDQETGKQGMEPLRTLGRYRNVNQGLIFATNLIPDNTGTIRVSDPVEAA